MAIFIINGLRFNCGTLNCPKAPKSCNECVTNRLKKMGFELSSDMQILSVDEKRIQAERNRIWQIFLDVLNIKHIILMDKESGIALLNYPVSAVDIEVELLSGFIQANITFSESSKGLNTDSGLVLENPFYELQYKKFNILLKNGDYIRLIMILDHNSSEHMKNLVSHFLSEFENRFKEQLIIYQNTGAFSSKHMVEFIIGSFNINFVFPMTLAYAIPPEFLEEINDDPIQSVIIKLAKDTLSAKSFFYINTLLEKLKKIVNIDAKVILHGIYNLLNKSIIVPMKLETVVSNLELNKEANHKRAIKIKPISSIIINDDDINELEGQMENLNNDGAKQLIKNLIKRGKTAEKSSTFDITRKEYNKALIVAKKFSLKDDINKISRMIFETKKKAKQVELDFALETGENAEKNNDYINAIYCYQKALKILEGFLIYDGSDSRIKKLKKKILKIREEM
ncbi:MAG: hypothetical protein ACFFDK_06680 [Promethearchaeota archaeon]